MHRPTVFVDADVLFSSTLRGWIFNLAMAGAFELLTTEDVIAEAVSSWRNSNPTAQGLVTTRMAECMRELSTVIRDFDATIEFPGSDQGDIHVHAACVAEQVEYLVTRDRGFHDLHQADKDALVYEIYDIDEFLLLVHNQGPMRTRELTLAEISRQVAAGRKPEVAEHLAAAGAPLFAKLVAQEARNLAGFGAVVSTRRRRGR